MLRRAMRQGTPQIRRGGDDSIDNFPVAARRLDATVSVDCREIV